MHTTPVTNNPHWRETVVPSDEHALTRHHPTSTVGSRGHSWCHTFCGFGPGLMTHAHHHSVTQSGITAPRITCPASDPLATPDPLIAPRVVPFPEVHGAGTKQSVAFPDGPLPSHTHLRLLVPLHELVAHFFLVLNTRPLSGVFISHPEAVWVASTSRCLFTTRIKRMQAPLCGVSWGRELRSIWVNPRHTLTGPCGESRFSFVRNGQTVFQSGRHTVCPPAAVSECFCSSTSPSAFGDINVLEFGCSTSCVAVSWCCLLFESHLLMACDTYHLFMRRWLSVHLPGWGVYARPLAHVKTGLCSHC